jgi:hypothetical protein
MKLLPTWVTVWGGLATALLYPSLYVFGFYVRSQTYLSATTPLEATLASASRRMAEGHLACTHEHSVGQRLTPWELDHLTWGIIEAEEGFKRVAGAWNEDDFDAVIHLNLRVTSGIRALEHACGTLGQFINSRLNASYAEYCNMSDYRTEDSDDEIDVVALAQTEREGEKKMREHAAELEGIRQMFVAARKEHDKRKVLFNAIAWLDFLFEAGGICCVVLGLQSVWKARRAAAHGEQKPLR